MDKNHHVIQAAWLGEVDYQRAWELQNRLAERIAAGDQPPCLLLLEHPHTYTIGRRGGRQHILWAAEEIERRGIAVYDVDRGGDITYHGPGQLVGYPLLPLAVPGWQGARLPQADFVGYARRLEQVLMRVLGEYGLPAAQRAGLTGVWVERGGGNAPVKIASIGVKVDARGVTRHGFALNVQPEMDYWQGIVPCGLDGVRMAALKEWVEPAPSVLAVARRTADAFMEVFEQPVEWVTKEAIALNAR
ncbi:MAG: lipoyl(octanoyl) transferase LipB [Chloroflexota bacterium]